VQRRVTGPFLALQWDVLLLEAGLYALMIAALPPADHAGRACLLAMPIHLLAFRLMVRTPVAWRGSPGIRGGASLPCPSNSWPSDSWSEHPCVEGFPYVRS
jgi:hypothetical protein